MLHVLLLLLHLLLWLLHLELLWLLRSMWLQHLLLAEPDDPIANTTTISAKASIAAIEATKAVAATHASNTTHRPC